MINVQLNYNKGYKWYSDGRVFVKGTAFYDDIFLEEALLLSPFKNIDSLNGFQQVLSKLNGIFSVIIKVDNEILLAATDPLRNFPLLYIHYDDNLYITDDYHFFGTQIPLEINKEAKRTMLSFGYVLGNATLLDQVFQLQAGMYLFFNRQELSVDSWHHFPGIKNEGDRLTWKKGLRKQIFLLSERLVKMIGDRPVALPLSGGFDSRLIALLLKYQNQHNVFCFTYGNPDYYEAKISKEVAKRLGYEWLFIDYTSYRTSDYIHTPQFQEYVDFAGNALTFPYNQEFFAAQYLKEIYKLSENTIFLPGHSGDMLAGSHLFPDMEFFLSKHDLVKKILRTNGNHLMLSRKDFRRLVTETGKHTHIEQIGFSHLAHDHWNIGERQSKQIVNSSKIWDFFDYKYLLPLWDQHFYDFFMTMPFSYRVYKNLYDEIVKELFLEYNILFLEEQSDTKRFKEKSFKRMKIKAEFPILVKLKKRLLEQPKDKFFFFDDFFAPMEKEISSLPKHSTGTAVLSAWYIEHVKQYCEQISLKTFK